jgi:class 3 adenylate cyclase
VLRIDVLGELELELDGTRLQLPASRRACSLLGLLALERRMHPRSELAARFWPDVLDESARTSLRGALAATRKALGPAAERYLETTRERAGLSTEVWTDAEQFERLAREDRYEEAMELWRGELLSGLNDDWVLVARDQWRERAIAALAGLADEAHARGDLGGAIGYARRMVLIDPLDEQALRALITLLAAGGNRAGALAAYGRYSERLRSELRTAPSAATRALAEELRGVETAGASTAEPAAEPATPGRPAPALGVAELPATGTVALLFTDLVGSTELLDRLGDEQAEELRRVHFGLLRDVAFSHAGYEVKNLGDGLMVAFASTVDAAACAGAIQQAVDRHNRTGATPRLEVRVGLHAGEPIREGDDYFGAAVVVAKRLCDCAQGGQILTSELVRELVAGRGGFAFRSLGELALKGFSVPLAACELAWRGAEASRIPLPERLTGEQGVLVGREAELQTLEQAWRQARDGRPQAALVSGDPGIGKTRLVTELCRRAHREGALVLFGSSTEEALAAYQPFIEALRQYVAVAPREELLAQVGARRALLGRLVPELSERDAAPDAEEGRGEAGGERYTLFDAVASFLRDTARSRPMILVLDDLHWADPPALLLLRHIIAAAGDAPLLIVGTYRQTEVHDEDPMSAALAELRRARSLTSLSLVGLSADGVAELVRDHGSKLDPHQMQALAERTEGNPFFIEEVVRQLDGGDGAFARALPESVKDLLLRRLRVLDETIRDILAAAAVLGRDFELAALERVTNRGEDELLDAMDAALAEHVIVESGGRPGSYSFAHPLIRETIYEQLSGTRRARTHARAGAALATLYDGELDEHASELALHFQRAGDDASSFEYELRAARVAACMHASDTAIAHFTGALESAARLGLHAHSDRRLRELLLERGWRHHQCGDFEAGAADYARALEASRAVGDRPLEAQALGELGFSEKQFDMERALEHLREALAIAEELDDSALQVRILSRLSLLLSNELDLAGAVQAGERALSLAREGTGERERVLAIDALKLAALQLGELERLAELTAALEETERRSGDLWYLQWTLLEGSFAPIGRARWDAAEQRLEEALAVSSRLGDQLAAPLMHDARCWLERSRGRYERSLAAGRRAAELTVPGSAGPWTAWTRATLGWCLLEVRAHADAVSLLDHAAGHAEMLADRLRVLGHLAWAHVLAGDLANAERTANEAEATLARVQLPPEGTFLFGFGALVSLGRAQIALGRFEAARAGLEGLLAAGRRTGWQEAVASAQLALGSLHAARGQPPQATQALRDAAELAQEHGLPGVEWEALGALAPLATAAEAEELRARSAAVVRRLAEGIGDRVLAAGLVQAAEG